jgi:hypothetical protein
MQSEDPSWSIGLCGDERYGDGDRVVAFEEGLRRQ